MFVFPHKRLELWQPADRFDLFDFRGRALQEPREIPANSAYSANATIQAQAPICSIRMSVRPRTFFSFAPLVTELLVRPSH